MLIKFWFGQLYIGRSWLDRHDATVCLCLWPRGETPPGEIAWRWSWRAAWNWLPDRLYRSTIAPWQGVSAASWTGRDKTLIGFGRWRRTIEHHRTTGSSKMYVYLTGQKEKANPRHVLYVAPAAVIDAAECPAEWRNHDGSPKTVEVVFVHGRADVPENMGKWLVATGQAQATSLVRATGKSMLGGLSRLIAGQAEPAYR